MWKMIFIGVLAVSLSFCKSTKYNSPAEFEGLKISFGNGGGFAGTYKEYLLCENGQLFYRSGMKNAFEDLGRIEKSQVKQAFENYKNLRIRDLQINDPGNLYYFLIDSEKKESHKIQWGGVQEKVPDYVSIYYRNLMNMVKGKLPVK